MEWQQIIGFHHLAKLGSFTRAAAATFRTQSALSQQIKALEEELDCPLVERIGKRKLRLTPAGERFAQFTEAILRRREQLQEEPVGGGPLPGRRVGGIFRQPDLPVAFRIGAEVVINMVIHRRVVFVQRR